MKTESKKDNTIFIESIIVENFRTFKGEAQLHFTKNDGSISQWTLILGDNGIGKSTLLQCVAWMKPDLQDSSGIGMTIKTNKIEPLINSESNEALQSFVSKGINPEKERTYIQGNFIGGIELGTVYKMSKKSWCKTTMEIKLNKKLKLKDVQHTFKTNSEDLFLKNSINVFGYSASRVLGKTNMTDPNLIDSLSSFLTDNTVLYDAEQILHNMNYAALGAKGEKEKKKYLDYLDVVKAALVSLLPDFENIDDIDIASPNLVDNIMQEGLLSVTTKHGKKIPFANFSLGYKTVMSWVIDLSWRLFNCYPESPAPLKEPAIVLIDELDLHLHPIWQRQIIKHLSKHFPKIQFIATAHSPLMVQAVFEENYAVLSFDKDNNCVKLINDIQSIDGWRVDQILTSDFFGLKTARGFEYEELLKKREKLLSRKRLNPKDKEELKHISNKISEYPVGETEEEIENRKIIKDVVNKIRDQKIKIEL